MAGTKVLYFRTDLAICPSPGREPGLLGPDDGPQLFELGSQAAFGLVTLRDPRAQVEQAAVGLGPLPHFAAEDHRGGGPVADHRGAGHVDRTTSRPS